MLCVVFGVIFCCFIFNLTWVIFNREMKQGFKFSRIVERVNTFIKPPALFTVLLFPRHRDDERPNRFRARFFTLRRSSHCFLAFSLPANFVRIPYANLRTFKRSNVP